MRITIIGAYGYTGLLICRKLEEKNIPFSVSGRNNEALKSIEEKFQCIVSSFSVDVQTEDGISKILDSSDLIINCAGPFTEESQKLILAIAQSGKTYLDITGEVGFVRESKMRYDRNAISSGALLIHGCAFESLPVDLAFAILAKSFNVKQAKIKETRTFYNFSQSRPSPGTKLTMKLARFRESLKISEGKWGTSDLLKDRLEINWEDETSLTVAVPYPLPEIAFTEWEYFPEESGSYLLLSAQEALFIKTDEKTGPTKEEIIQSHKQRKNVGPNEEERKLQQSKIVVSMKDSNGNHKSILLTGTDMYLITANCILLAVSEIINGNQKLKGVIHPARLFEGRENEALRQIGIEMSEIKNFNIK
jgi:short subunit dehydrogenase-like uncharacterized protein